MAIEIKTEKCFEKGVWGFRVISVKAMGQEDLPKAYLQGKPYCYSVTGPNSAKELRINPGKGYEFDQYDTLFIEPGRHYEYLEFQKRIDVIRAAGDRLKRINDLIREGKQFWHGECEFII